MIRHLAVGDGVSLQSHDRLPDTDCSLLGDDVVQETTRMIVGIQVFVVGVDLPKWYAR